MPKLGASSISESEALSKTHAMVTEISISSFCGKNSNVIHSINHLSYEHERIEKEIHKPSFNISANSHTYTARI